MPRYLCYLLLVVSVLSASCSSAPRRELQSARLAVAQARHAGADQWASAEYSSASESLKTGEELVRQGRHKAAQEVLPQAELQARQAIAVTRRQQQEAVRIRQEAEAAEAGGAAAETARPEETKADAKRPPRPAAPPPAAKPKPPADIPQPLSVIYQVGADETLWAISARREIYGDPLLWPLLYQANRDQIKDPRQIYPGQVLSIPRDTSSREREEAREKARRSDIFPVETLQNRPAPTKKGS